VQILVIFFLFSLLLLYLVLILSQHSVLTLLSLCAGVKDQVFYPFKVNMSEYSFLYVLLKRMQFCPVDFSCSFIRRGFSVYFGKNWFQGNEQSLQTFPLTALYGM
jgi:hypothetical protein